MASYRLAFLGDIVGRPGREAVLRGLSHIRDQFQPLFTVANAENAAAGMGVTPEIADALYDAGIDAITLGNHAFNRRDVYRYLEAGRPIVRPANMAPSVPGKGVASVTKDGVELTVVNLCGRVFMDGYDDPFAAADRIVAGLSTPHVLIDFHAEATSEKVAFGYHVDGRVTAVVGTHTHVTTADETVLEGGTAYITDVGMCGPVPSVIGVDRDIVLHRFRTSLPTRFEVADEPGVICGVVIDVDRVTGRASAIRRFRLPDAS